MSDKPEFRHDDPDVVEAARAQLEALDPTDEERKIAARFAKIDSETAHKIALLLRAGQHGRS